MNTSNIAVFRSVDSDGISTPGRFQEKKYLKPSSLTADNGCISEANHTNISVFADADLRFPFVADAKSVFALLNCR
jgi:hypothetical protein